ncbi:DUF1254 domain-containing protein [Bradyrhizobium sp. 2]|uniref:DUF1254 domain-containing protein n=1 Tax=unclassified Bradyrhizobium TaxID=2631580 RepID=UPI001FF7A6AD|nr:MULTISPECIES: DUF1254 domain-containing protein [unclassified Bradyrhizobium]MCK1448827.1 DUF1254 domain-containing protein [Bradyrhizobium sp. 48]MCK1465513.1 DUF1254 domain-containing protein [Bradyrhizobium sp. 2]
MSMRKQFVAILGLLLGAALTPAANAQQVTGKQLQAGDELAYQLAFQRGAQAVIWGAPAASMMGLIKSAKSQLGAVVNEDIIYFSKPMVSRHGFLTPNNQTPYVFSLMNTKGGPMVLEVPPASPKVIFFGTATDTWQVPIVDVGPEGEDKGKGGKYLFLPPGYEGEVPKGYFVLRPATYHVSTALRPIQIKGGTLEEAVAYSKQLKAYPLSQAKNPKPNRYIDAFPKTWDTLPHYNLSWFEDLAAVVNEEPVQTQDLVMMGMLPTIGIEKDKPFKPNPVAAKALDEAITLAYAEMLEYFITPGKGFAPYWSDRQWGAPNFPREVLESGFHFAFKDQYLLDHRAGGFAFWATWVPKHLGKATFYLMGQRDKDGKLFDGSSTYRLRVPKDTPAAEFWSVIVYSRTKDSFAALIPKSERVGTSSYEKAELKSNADGSIDIYFGPKAPPGFESNWLPTGQDFFLLFRLYGPEKSLYDKSWTLPDVEKVS